MIVSDFTFQILFLIQIALKNKILNFYRFKNTVIAHFSYLFYLSNKKYSQIFENILRFSLHLPEQNNLLFPHKLSIALFLTASSVSFDLNMLIKFTYFSSI